MKGHVTLVAVAEVRPHVGRPLVSLPQDHAVAVAIVELLTDLLDNGVRLRKVFAAGAVTFDQIRDGVEPHAVHAQIHPESQHLQDTLDHDRVVEVQIRLVRKEAMPVVRLRRGIPGPVRRLGVGEDDPHAAILLIRVAPHVDVPLRRAGRRRPGRLKPGMLIGGVIDDQLGDDFEPAIVGGPQQPLKILHRSVTRVDARVVGNVISVVTQGRWVERQQP